MSRRGQATLEFALGSLLFVTVILFGVYFGEVGYAQLRLVQAHNTALWDGAKLRTHDVYNDPGRFFAIEQIKERYDGTSNSWSGDTVNVNGTRMFADLDGRRKNDATWRNMFSRADGVAFSCRSASIAIPPSGPAFDELRRGFRPARRGGAEVDGMRCHAEARLASVNLPRALFEGSGGFFNEQHGPPLAIPLCSFGRAQNGQCTNSVPVMTEKYVLRGNQGGRGILEHGGEDADCHKELGIGCHNQAYKRTAERVFDAYGRGQGTAASRLFDWAIGPRMLDSHTEGVEKFNRQFFGSAKHYGRGENEFNLVHTGEYRPDLGTENDGVGFWCQQDVDFRNMGELPAFFHTVPGHEGSSWCPITYAASPAKGPYAEAYRERGHCFLGVPCPDPAD